jgi:hypothetical protein
MVRGLTLSGDGLGAGLGGGFSGGLITGVFAPLCGGGVTISASPVGGGLKTLGSSVGAGGLAGLASGAGRGAVAGGLARSAADAHALLPNGIARITALTKILMAHLIGVLRPHIHLYAAMMAKPC